MDHTIRAVRYEDWPRTKEIRLAALRDPLAHLAFLDTYQDAAARPDDFWQGRAAGAAEGKDTRQFIAEGTDGRWLGTVTVRVELPGSATVFGEAPESPQTHIVGVFVQPEARGTGVARELFHAAVEWSFALPGPRIERVRLYVHQDNARAEALYEKAGFERTGAWLPLDADPTQRENELALSRP